MYKSCCELLLDDAQIVEQSSVHFTIHVGVLWRDVLDLKHVLATKKVDLQHVAESSA